MNKLDWVLRPVGKQVRRFRLRALRFGGQVAAAGSRGSAALQVAVRSAFARCATADKSARGHLGNLMVLAVLLAVPATAAAQEHGAAEEHGVLSGLFWPTINFAILVGVLWWFLKQPIATYLADRHQSIRKDLVEAANIKASAAAQLSEIDRKLQALPGELDALKHRAAEEIASEEQRIAALAAAERDRMLEQTRREIELQVRLAKRELVEHAADLSVQLATERIQKTITPADQDRLVDRYLNDVAGSGTKN